MTPTSKTRWSEGGRWNPTSRCDGTTTPRTRMATSMSPWTSADGSGRRSCPEGFSTFTDGPGPSNRYSTPVKGRPYHRWIFSYTVMAEDVDADGDLPGARRRRATWCGPTTKPGSSTHRPRRSHSPTAHEGLADQSRPPGERRRRAQLVARVQRGARARDPGRWRSTRPDGRRGRSEVGAPVTATDP